MLRFMFLFVFLYFADGSPLLFQPIEKITPAKLRSPLNSASPPAPPTWGQFYTVSGEIQLPYAELVEPFRVWFDARSSKSRVEYYDGTARTYLRGDRGEFGTAYKVNPMTDDTTHVLNQLICFQVNGSKDAPIQPQGVLPDVSTLKYVGGGELVDGHQCQRWEDVVVRGSRKNTYTLWVSDDERQEPVRYEMMGYDSLLGSHFDHYIVRYAQFNNLVEPMPSDFELPKELPPCRSFPGPGWEHMAALNPLGELVAGEAHHETAFERFKTRHNIRYESSTHEDFRKSVFKNNVRFIHSTNRRQQRYRLAVNHLADRTPAELRSLRGFRATPAEVRKPTAALPFGASPFPHSASEVRRLAASLPDQWDWRLYGAVTPVKDQAICGSCWSFGSTGVVEGAYFLKYKQLVRLSQQQLVDCSWGEGNNGCDGGEDFRSYNWLMKNGGLAAEEDYEYRGQNGFCNLNVARVAKLSGFVNVTPSDVDAFKVALTQHGPLSVAIDASHLSFSFYASGVYYEPTCGSGLDNLDHAVLAVGYGTLNGEPYWLVKNSWSTWWGNDGYVLMSQRNNNCGVMTDATYPTIV